MPRGSDVAHAAVWGLVAAAVLMAGIYFGSRGLRDFDPALVPYAGASVFAAFGIGYRYSMWLRRPPTRMYWYRGWEIFADPRKLPSNPADVPAGSSLLFRYPTEADPCILLRSAGGKLRAYSQVCTHLSCAVTYRRDHGDLYCPCHIGIFNVAEGRPTAGPPLRSLPRIVVEERGEQIFAVGKEEA